MLTLRLPPRHELLDAGTWVAIEDGAEGVGEADDGVQVGDLNDVPGPYRPVRPR
jgi:hypothetical protein